MNTASVEAIKRHPTSLEPPAGRRRRRWLLGVPIAVVLVLLTWLLGRLLLLIFLAFLLALSLWKIVET